MPTGVEMEVVFRLNDGTEIKQIGYLDDVLTFLEEHKEEFVKVVRCKDCRYYMPKTHSCTMASLMCPDETDFCSRGKKVEVVHGN